MTTAECIEQIATDLNIQTQTLVTVLMDEFENTFRVNQEKLDELYDEFVN